MRESVRVEVDLPAAVAELHDREDIKANPGDVVNVSHLKTSLSG